MNAPNWLQREPVIYHHRSCLRLRAACRPHTAWTGSSSAGKVLPWGRLELDVGLDTAVPSHLVGSHPSRVLEFSLNLFAAHLLGDV
jgi:hypothetical protein